MYSRIFFSTDVFGRAGEADRYHKRTALKQQFEEEKNSATVKRRGCFKSLFPHSGDKPQGPSRRSPPPCPRGGACPLQSLRADAVHLPGCCDCFHTFASREFSPTRLFSCVRPSVCFNFFDFFFL